MSKAIILDDGLAKVSEVELPAHYTDINEHNLYLYIKSYLASCRSNNASAKTRGNVSGGGKKPWAQKGGGRARAGSITSPIFVGGGVSHGPSNNKNYDIKINRKQKKLALEYALNQKANEGKLYIKPSLSVDSGKTKDAYKIVNRLGERTTLLVLKDMSESTFLAYRNISQCYPVELNSLNAYLIAYFRSVVFEQAAFDEIVKKD
ncbi:50S ribosomal protein L4 [Helicobacter sp. 13S00401-1]|uniref:50S ribosomal protein L4 n=1 Tax=Helicobacter sp. 13S00401-1 TaxID=1905758 RepID=UPI000BA6C55E|nr:50S ribosomal protein L4 [Helicobacter sp. 13S00401-1]PAF51168.1 50S ribosomal protein L4 [Helicobacter sp. 13S00401-1]